MHFHKYKKWEEYAEYGQNIDGYFAYSVTVFISFCEKCGMPKRKKIKH